MSSVTKLDSAGPMYESDGWNVHAKNYQDSIGACTLPGTARLIDVANSKSPFSEDSYVLDNGSGAGSIVINLKQKFPALKILASDISTAMLEQVDKLRLPGLTTQPEDAVHLSGLADNTFTHVLTSFMIQFTPDPKACLHAMYRVLKPGCVVGIAIWAENADAMVIHNKATSRIVPGYQAPSPHPPNSWATPEEHKSAMIEAGFRKVETEPMSLLFPCRDADHWVEYWFASGNPVPTLALKHFQEHGGDIEALKVEIRRVVREDYDNGQSIYFGSVLGWGKK